MIKFGSGEPWKKVFGPVFIYLNSVADKHDTLSLWDDAKERVLPLRMLALKAYFCTYMISLDVYDLHRPALCLLI